jgi:hypothetical protein
MESRHLSWEHFDALVQAGPPAVEVVTGDPRVEIFSDAGGFRIGLRTPDPGLVLPPSPLVEIEIKAREADGRPIVEISTANRSLYRDFYAFACSVADRLQIDGLPPGRAIDTSLDAWAALLRELVVLPPEKQIGLLGELWLFERIGREHGFDVAVSAWKGTDAEEHDFSVGAVDIEVKTTQSERRVHMIGSLTQLLPVPGRPLFLLSLQFTDAGASGKSTLTDRVAELSARVAAEAPAAVDGFRDRLAGAGWRKEHAPHYRRNYRTRSSALLLPVDGTFPAIVPEVLGTLGPERLARIQHVSYRIDVTGLGHEDGSVEFLAVLPGGSEP